MAELENPNYWRLLVNQSFLRFYLLKTLSQEPIHGYGLQPALRVISQGLCNPSQGTIYPALKELEKNGYLKGEWKKIKNRKRKIYALTPTGRKALQVSSAVIEKALRNLFEEKKEKPQPPLPTPPVSQTKKQPSKLPLRF